MIINYNRLKRKYPDIPTRRVVLEKLRKKLRRRVKKRSKEHEKSSRPMLFFNENSDFPYWGKGSAFFVVRNGDIFLATAKHVVKNQQINHGDLMITPEDDSSTPIAFSEEISIEDAANDNDFNDISIFRVCMEDYMQSKNSDIYAWDVERDFYDCENLNNNESLYIIGYPSEFSFVDYDAKRIHSARVIVRCLYKGPSPIDHCHTMCLETSVEINDLDGLSGGAVFRYPESNGELVQLVGMVIRGTYESKILHFIDCSILRELVWLSDE